MDDNDEERWKVLSLTHVEYLEGDNVGKFFAIFSLLPLAIVIIFLTTFFFRRDLHTMTFGIGVIVNYVANVALKKYIAEPRPKMRYFFEQIAILIGIYRFFSQKCGNSIKDFYKGGEPKTLN